MFNARIQRVLSEGVQVIFLVDGGRDDPNTTKSGPSSALQRNAIDGSTLNAGLVAL